MCGCPRAAGIACERLTLSGHIRLCAYLLMLCGSAKLVFDCVVSVREVCEAQDRAGECSVPFPLWQVLHWGSWHVLTAEAHFLPCGWLGQEQERWVCMGPAQGVWWLQGVLHASTVCLPFKARVV